MSENKNCIISKEKILNGFTVSRIIRSSSDIGNSKGYLADITIPWSINETEETAYEIYREIIESTLGAPTTVIINFDTAYEEKLRALLLAAVYGRVDLLIGNLISKEEIATALQIFHKVFCELESDKKEFNGYII